MRSPQGRPNPRQMECSPRPMMGGHRSPDAPRPIRRRVTSERISPPAQGRDKKCGELSPRGLVFFGVPWWSVVGLVLMVVVVVAEVFWGAHVVNRRSWDPGYAHWILGRGFESHRGGLCWSARAGDPRSRPRTPSSTSARRYNRKRRPGTRPDSDPQLAYPPWLEGPIKASRLHFFLGVCLCVAPVCK